MKVYIQTDIEGCCGFCFFEERGNPSYENVLHRHRMYRLLTNEVNAAAKAAFDAGATEVIINDSHSSGYNIFFEDLDPRCRIIHGANCSGPHWMPLLDSSFDAIVLIGMHAMGGTAKAITPHSKWCVNDGAIYMSEGTMAAAIAGDHGVPAVMVSGDDKITAEFAEKIPNIERVAVKQALSPYQACSMIPSKACEEIAFAVRRGLENRKNIKPYKIPGPVKLVLLDNVGPNAKIWHAPPLEPIGDAVTANTIDEAFMVYEKAMFWNSFDTEQLTGIKYP